MRRANQKRAIILSLVFLLVAVTGAQHLLALDPPSEPAIQTESETDPAPDSSLQEPISEEPEPPSSLPEEVEESLPEASEPPPETEPPASSTESAVQNEPDTAQPRADTGIMPLAAPIMTGATEGTDYELVYLDDERTQVDENSIIILTGKGLDVALSGSDTLTSIYMGADITYGSAIIAHANKSGGTLYGYRPENPAQRYTLYWSGLTTACLRWNNTTSFTIASMTIYCATNYGVLYSLNTTRDLTIRDVVYYGPQLGYYAGNYTLDNLTMYHRSTTVEGRTGPLEEVLQDFNSVTIKNNVTIISESSLYSQFNFRTNGQFIISEGASFTMESPSSYLLSGGSTLQLTLENNAKWDVQAEYTGNIADFTVGANAEFKMEGGTGNQNVLQVTRNLNVNGASLVQLTHGTGITGSGDGLYYTGSNDGTFQASTITMDTASNCVDATNSSATLNITADNLNLNSRGGAGIYFTGGTLNVLTGNLGISSNSHGIYSTKPTSLGVVENGTIQPTSNNAHGIYCTNSNFTLSGGGSLVIDTTSTTGGNGLNLSGGTISGMGSLNIQCNAADGMALGGDTTFTNNSLLAIDTLGSGNGISITGTTALTVEGAGNVFINAADNGVYTDSGYTNSITFSGQQYLEINATNYCVYANRANTTFNFNAPQVAVLAAGAGSVFWGYTTSTNLNFTTTALNRWSSNIGIANIPATPPDNIWNLATGQMSISGTSGGTGSTYNITNDSGLPKQATDPVDSDLNTNNLNLANTPLLVFGELTVTLNTLYTESPAIEGTTAGNAQLNGTAVVEGASLPFNGTAGAEGAFSLSVLPHFLDEGEKARVTALSGQLRANGETTVQDSSEFVISLTEVPATCDFGTQNTTTQTAFWVAPTAPLVLKVEDNRLRRGAWQITAVVDGPLRAEVDGQTYEIHDAMAKRGAGDTPEPLSATPIVVHSNTGDDDGEILVDLTQVLGLYLQPGDGMAGVVYSAKIRWVLSEV